MGSASTSSDPSGESRRFEELAVLQRMCHAFASTADVDELSTGAIRWFGAALGDSIAPLRLILPDQSGRLRPTVQQGEFPAEGRKRSFRRRAAFVSMRAAFLELPNQPDHLLAMLPLVSRGEPEGLIEIVAPRHAIEERWATLEAAAGLTAIALRTYRQRTSLAAELQAVEQAAELTSEIVRADTPELAARATIRYCSRRFRLPVAAWIRKGHGPIMAFSGVEGVGARKRSELRSALPTLQTSPALDDQQRADLSRRFQEITGIPHVIVIDAGDAVLAASGLVPGGDARLRSQLEILGRLLADVIRHLAAVAKANHRNENLDLGIAWTAHELRGPLLGTRATIERLLGSGGLPANEELLRRSRDELARLAGLVDAVLRWSVGDAKLQLRAVDLARLVRDCAEAIGVERREDRIRIRAAPTVTVWADPVQLGVAIDNLIRNALHYSPPGSDVAVSVTSDGRHGTVSVKDEGSGIPLDERDSIFDPLVRGRASSGGKRGNGLGLFVAKRVVDAHGGEIWLEPAHAPETAGTTFHIRLPLPRRDSGRPISPRPKVVPKED
jgi:signal transduction histidine kinase